MIVYLSICIPTYNRKSYLQKTIDSIISQAFFQSGEVEIIVSDNASVDGTEAMMRQYVVSASHIRYYRNETNEGPSINIYKVLTLGNGLYRKISNDTYSFKDGSLERIVDCIKKNASDRPFMVFTNSNIDNMQTESIYLGNLDQFVRTVSYHITDDAMVGFWDTELPSITLEDAAVWFWGIHAIFRIINAKLNVIIYNFELYTVALPKNKDLTYGLIPIFYTAYLKCYNPYIGKEIKRRTYRQERRKLLYGFFLQWFLKKEISSNWRFSPEDNVRNLRKVCASRLILFSILLKLLVSKKKIRSLLHNLGSASGSGPSHR